jgi:hypothetical protein
MCCTAQLPMCQLQLMIVIIIISSSRFRSALCSKQQLQQATPRLRQCQQPSQLLLRSLRWQMAMLLLR